MAITPIPRLVADNSRLFQLPDELTMQIVSYLSWNNAITFALTSRQCLGYLYTHCGDMARSLNFRVEWLQDEARPLLLYPEKSPEYNIYSIFARLLVFFSVDNNFMPRSKDPAIHYFSAVQQQKIYNKKSLGSLHADSFSKTTTTLVIANHKTIFQMIPDLTCPWHYGQPISEHLAYRTLETLIPEEQVAQEAFFDNHYFDELFDRLLNLCMYARSDKYTTLLLNKLAPLTVDTEGDMILSLGMDMHMISVLKSAAMHYPEAWPLFIQKISPDEVHFYEPLFFCIQHFSYPPQLSKVINCFLQQGNQANKNVIQDGINLDIGPELLTLLLNDMGTYQQRRAASDPRTLPFSILENLTDDHDARLDGATPYLNIVAPFVDPPCDEDVLVITKCMNAPLRRTLLRILFDHAISITEPMIVAALTYYPSLIAQLVPKLAPGTSLRLSEIRQPLFKEAADDAIVDHLLPYITGPFDDYIAWLLLFKPALAAKIALHLPQGTKLDVKTILTTVISPAQIDVIMNHLLPFIIHEPKQCLCSLLSSRNPAAVSRIIPHLPPGAKINLATLLLPGLTSFFRPTPVAIDAMLDHLLPYIDITNAQSDADALLHIAIERRQDKLLDVLELGICPNASHLLKALVHAPDQLSALFKAVWNHENFFSFSFTCLYFLVGALPAWLFAERPDAQRT